MLLSYTTEAIITINNNNKHNYNNNIGYADNATECKRVVPPNDATKSAGVDTGAIAT